MSERRKRRLTDGDDSDDGCRFDGNFELFFSLFSLPSFLPLSNFLPSGSITPTSKMSSKMRAEAIVR